MKLKKGYRIPSLVEMQTQGFEYEVYERNSWRFVFIDFSDPANSDTSQASKWYHNNRWIKCKVWWHYKPDEFITDTYEDGATITITGRTANFFRPYSDSTILEKLSKGEIRCRT